VSPDFTLLSLLDFEPPPPILTNQRLPPLGALGRAPSPPAPLPRRHNRSLSPGSPPPLQRSSAFRPLTQRYNYMNRESKICNIILLREHYTRMCCLRLTNIQHTKFSFSRINFMLLALIIE